MKPVSCGGPNRGICKKTVPNGVVAVWPFHVFELHHDLPDVSICI